MKEGQAKERRKERRCKGRKGMTILRKEDVGVGVLGRGERERERTP
jgi:hypothetical protein